MPVLLMVFVEFSGVNFSFFCQGLTYPEESECVGGYASSTIDGFPDRFPELFAAKQWRPALHPEGEGRDVAKKRRGGSFVYRACSWVCFKIGEPPKMVVSFWVSS